MIVDMTDRLTLRAEMVIYMNSSDRPTDPEGKNDNLFNLERPTDAKGKMLIYLNLNDPEGRNGNLLSRRQQSCKGI